VGNAAFVMKAFTTLLPQPASAADAELPLLSILDDPRHSAADPNHWLGYQQSRTYEYNSGY
jgi:hypothetical protein